MIKKYAHLIVLGAMVTPSNAWAQSANQSITNSTHASITIKQYGNPGEHASGVIDSSLGTQSDPIIIDIGQLARGALDAHSASGQIINTLEGSKIEIRQQQRHDWASLNSAFAKIENAGVHNDIKIHQRSVNNVLLESGSDTQPPQTSTHVEIGAIEGSTPANTRDNKVFVDQIQINGSIIDLSGNTLPLPTRHVAEVVINDSYGSDILVDQNHLVESSAVSKIRYSGDITQKIHQNALIQSLVDVDAEFTFDANHTIKQSGDTNQISVDSQIAREQVLDIDQSGKDQDITIEISSTNKITKGEFIQKDANNVISFNAETSDNIDAKIEQSGSHTSKADIDIISLSDNIFLRLKQFDAEANLIVEGADDVTLNIDQERAYLEAHVKNSQNVSITANQTISEPVDIAVGNSSNISITSNLGNLPTSFLTNF